MPTLPLPPSLEHRAAALTTQAPQQLHAPDLGGATPFITVALLVVALLMIRRAILPIRQFVVPVIAAGVAVLALVAVLILAVVSAVAGH